MNYVFVNGTILTMDDSCPKVEAVLIENGKIVKCGTQEEVLSCKTQDTVLVDLQGKTLLPGFIDGHSHFSGLASALSQCDLSRTENFQDIVTSMKAFIEKRNIPKGQWVVGTNYDHNFLKEKRHPDKMVLDEISKEYPIMVVHASSHMGVCNSLGLEIQGLTENTKDPEGGCYGRIQGSRELNGYMEENAFVACRNQMPMPGIEDMMENFKQAQEIYASYGITTIQEGMVTEQLFQILEYACKKQELYLDLVGYLDLEHCRTLLTQRQELLHQYTNHFRIGGYKVFLDGSPQGRTAWMLEPYEQAEDGYCGYPIHSDEKLEALVLAALEDGQQLLAHCNGDAAAEQYIRVFEKVAKEHPQYTTNRPVMIHAQLVQEEQLKRMKEISMMPSFFVAHVYYWGDIHIQNFGKARAKRISPAGTALRFHLPFTFHQDSPVLMPNVLETIWCAASRVTKAGVQLEENEKISVYDGLKAMTIHGAYQYGEEQSKGMIKEGYVADLIILDKNLLEVPVEEVKNVKVLETIKEGKTIYKRK